MTGKLLRILLCGFLLIGYMVVPVGSVASAAENGRIVFYEDYTLQTPSFATTLINGGKGEWQTADGNGFYRLFSVPSQRSYLSAYLPETYDDTVITLDCKFRLNQLASEIDLFDIFSVSNGGYVPVLYIDTDGSLKNGQNQTIGQILTGEWIRFSCMLDLSQDICTIYRDGILISEGSLPAGHIGGLSRVNIQAAVAQTDATSLDIDRFMVYTGGFSAKEIDRYTTVEYTDFFTDLTDVALERRIADYTVLCPESGWELQNGNKIRVSLSEQDLSAILAGTHSDYPGFASREYIEEYGLILLGSRSFDGTEDELSGLRKLMLYDRPSGDAVTAALTAHPRLSLTASRLSSIQRSLQTEDEYSLYVYEQLKAYCDGLLSASPISYQNNNGEIAYASQIPERISALALMYRLDGSNIYLARALSEMESVLSFPDWGGNYLSNSYIAVGMALGYDWLNDKLSTTTKDQMEQAFYTCFLSHYALDYAGVSGARSASYRDGTGNVNTVVSCANILVSLALADQTDYADICRFNLTGAMRALENSLETYETNDGASEESVSYHNGMAAAYLAYAMDALDSAAPTVSTGYRNTRSLERMPLFSFAMEGPAGTNTYHDTYVGDYGAKPSRIASTANPWIFYLSALYDLGLKSFYQKQILENRVIADSPFCLIWQSEEEDEREPSKDVCFGGTLDMAVFRNSFADENSVYLAAHGGKNYVNHGHTDAGTFVFQAMGTTWIDDLGADNYSSGYTMKKQDSYRIRAEGHNVYLINPRADSESTNSDGNTLIYAGQALNGKAMEIDYQVSDNGGFVIYDLSDCYREDVSAAKRGFYLADNRESLVIRDEITLKKSSDIVSFLHTMGEITVLSDTTALLKRDNKTLFAELSSSEENAHFTVMGAESLLSDFTPLPNAADNSDYRKLTIRLSGSGEVFINVKLTPVYEAGQTISSFSEPLNAWTLPQSGAQSPALYSVFHNGTPVTFDPQNRAIHLPLSNTADIGAVTAEGDGNVMVFPGKNLFEQTVIKVQKNGRAAYYTVDYRPSPVKADPNTAELCGITSITKVKENVDVTEILTDNNQKTYLYDYVYNDELLVELSETSAVSELYLSFAAGVGNRYYYDVGFSADGENWTFLRNLSSSGTTMDYEKLCFGAVPAKYIKIILNGQDDGPRTCLSNFAVASVSIDAQLIGSYADFLAIRENPAGTYYVVSDLVFPESYEPISGFSGKLVGYDTDSGTETEREIQLNINRPDTDGVGLFSYVSGTNLRISHIKTSGTVTGGAKVGGLFGYSEASGSGSRIAHCSNEAAVTGTVRVGGIGGDMYTVSPNGLIVEECSNSGTVQAAASSGNGFAGGILGVTNKYLTLRKLRNTGIVTAAKAESVGGIVGCAYGSIEECYNTGRISGTRKVGGIAGSMAESGTSVKNCFNTGSISAASGAGGIAGEKNKETLNNIQLLSCYNTGTVSNGTAQSAEVLMKDWESMVSAEQKSYFLSDASVPLYGLTSFEMKDLSFLEGFDSQVWQIDYDSAYNYPVLTFDGASRVEQTLPVYSAAELAAVYAPEVRTLRSAETEPLSISTPTGTVTLQPGEKYICLISEINHYREWNLEECGIYAEGQGFLRAEVQEKGKNVILFLKVPDGDFVCKPYSIYSNKDQKVTVYGEEMTL